MISTMDVDKSTSLITCEKYVAVVTSKTQNSNVTWALWRLKWPATLTIFFNSLPQLKTRETIKAPLYWPFVREIQQWSVNIPHKGVVMREAYRGHNVVMTIWPWYGKNRLQFYEIGLCYTVCRKQNAIHFLQAHRQQLTYPRLCYVQDYH